MWMIEEQAGWSVEKYSRDIEPEPGAPRQKLPRADSTYLLPILLSGTSH